MEGRVARICRMIKAVDMDEIPPKGGNIYEQ